MLAKFRAQKTFLKKLNKAIGKGEADTARRLRESKPKYTLDHIIRERYPSFTDAVRDLDDPLCMIHLFASLPVINNAHKNSGIIGNNNSDSAALVPAETIEKCRRLSREFELYVIEAKCLRKSFLSIKGIYYEAEIQGESVTWLVPHDFKQKIPDDVDFRVMATFLEFSVEMLGFVLFKLFADLGIKYPLKLDEKKEELLSGYEAYSLIRTDTDGDGDSIVATAADDSVTAAVVASAVATKKQLKMLEKKIQKIKEDLDDDEEDEDQDQYSVDHNADNDNVKDAFVGKSSSSSSSSVVDSSIATLSSLQAHADELVKFKDLFKGLCFFIGREVSRSSVEFVCKCFGATVGWELGSGSPLTDASDPRITHVITDRPVAANAAVSKTSVRVQPQWVFDCINKKTLLSTASYGPGSELPAHLSPFVSADDAVYDPEATYLQDQDENVEDESVESVKEEESEDDENVTPEKPQIMAEEDRKKMAVAMMSKKDRQLYQKMMHGKRKRNQEASKLLSKRKKIEKEKKSSSQGQ